MKKFPFFVVVDDGAFPEVDSKGHFYNIGIEVYETIARLAREFKTRIPICLTMKYLDNANISGIGEPLDYVSLLMDFFKYNNEYIEIGYHGLNHTYNDHIGEFFCLDTGEPVPEDIQRKKIADSAKIFEYHSMPFPELCVPPFHAWEQGITDKILSEFGVKNLVTFKKLNFNNHFYEWNDSQYLQLFDRDNIGIYSYHTVLTPSNVDKVKRYLRPRKMIDTICGEKTIFNVKKHSYMTHIGNFLPANYDFWHQVFKIAEMDTRMGIMPDSATAAHALSKKV